MNSLLEKKYINKILSNKNVLISELTDEFGSEYEGLLNERFDKIKFVFFASLTNYKRYLRKRYSYLAANKIVEFIKENGILNDVYVDDSFKDICGYTIESKNEEDLFYNIFNNRFLDFDFEGKRKNVFGIYSFDASLDYNELSTYAQYRNITTEEFIRNNRCDFLRNIGKYPADYTNEMICNDANYLNLCHYYEGLMQKYNNTLNDVKVKLENDIDIFNKLESIRKKLFVNNYKKMLEELTAYLSDDDKKKVASGNYNLREIDFLNMFFYNGQSLNDESKIETSSAEEIQELYSLYYGESNQKKDIVQIIKNAREKAAKRYNKQILEAFTFESNYDISGIEMDTDLSLSDLQLFASFEQEDGIEKNRLLFFDPYACDEEYLDIHLRHEIRHSLTSSVRRENNLDIVKVGNAEYIYSGEKLITVNNEFYNELLTQKKAIENTKASFGRGIYILSPNGISFPNGLTSGYDEYLSEFDKIYSVIPQSAMVSQIEINNENLYRFISLDEIKKLEDSLQNYNNIPDDILGPDLSGNKKSK